MNGSLDRGSMPSTTWLARESLITVSESIQPFTFILTWRFGLCSRAPRPVQSDGGQSPETFPPITLVPARVGILGRRFVPSLVTGMIGQLTCYAEKLIQITVSLQVRSHRRLEICFADVPSFCKALQRMRKLGVTRRPNRSMVRPLPVLRSHLQMTKHISLFATLAPANGASALCR